MDLKTVKYTWDSASTYAWKDTTHLKVLAGSLGGLPLRLLKETSLKITIN